MKHFLVSMAILTALNTTWANLGDNGDKIEDLYGNIVQRRLGNDETVSVVYHKDKYLYLVVFANDHSILERYSHANNTGLSEKEIARFLKTNAGGATWASAPNNKATERRFERSDHRAEATYGDVNGRMALTVREKQSKR
jgi:hypothetical protein